MYFQILLEESVLFVSPKELALLMMMGGEQPLMETANVSLLISPLSNKLSPGHLKPISETDENLVLHQIGHIINDRSIL